VVSPSAVVTDEGRPQLDAGIAVLEDLGLRVRLADHALSASLGYSATPAEKAADLNRMVADPEVRAIMCTQGGTTANACLPLLDWPALAANPKVLVGMSDITVLVNAVFARTGLITFHGPDLMWGLGRDPSAYDVEEFTARLVDGTVGPVRPAGPRGTIRPGVAEGPLLGGNVECLRKLAGTPFAPDVTGAVLLLETLGFAADAGHCCFHHLAQAGMLDRVAGIVVGHVDGDGQAPPLRLVDVLVEVLDELGCDVPVLRIADIGHNCPNTVLPIGARVRMDADRHLLEIAEPCLA